MATDTDFDLDLGYRHINKDFMSETYDAPVGGQTHTERTARDRAIMQAQVLSAVSFAIVPELTNEEIKERISDVAEAVEKGKNRALTDAQQVITTAYSLGQMDSINTSVDNGVSGGNTWRAVLDGKTRPEHANEDGDIRDESTGLFTLSNGSTLEQPRLIGRGSAGLGDIIRCRCWMFFRPDGVEPSPRSAKMEDGSWEDVHGDTTWEEWSKTIEGERTIDGEKLYRKIRAKRLAARRAALRDGATTGDSATDSINSILNRRGGTVEQQIEDINETLDRIGQDAWVDSLTKDELDSLTYYTGVGDNPINTLLRENELSGLAELRGLTVEEIRIEIANIQKGINKLTLSEDIVVWRNPGLDIIDQYIDADIGDIIIDNGFSSTSMRSDIFGFAQDINDEGKFKLEILMRQGSHNAPLSTISQNTAEVEVLLNNGASLQKIGNRVDEATGITFIQLEAI